MGESRADAVAVVDLDDEAVALVAVGVDHPARGGRDDRRPRGRGDVNAFVRTILVQDRMEATLRELAGEPPRRGHNARRAGEPLEVALERIAHVAQAIGEQRRAGDEALDVRPGTPTEAAEERTPPRGGDGGLGARQFGRACGGDDEFLGLGAGVADGRDLGWEAGEHPQLGLALGDRTQRVVEDSKPLFDGGDVLLERGILLGHEPRAGRAPGGEENRHRPADEHHRPDTGPRKRTKRPARELNALGGFVARGDEDDGPATAGRHPRNLAKTGWRRGAETPAGTLGGRAP